MTRKTDLNLIDGIRADKREKDVIEWKKRDKGTFNRGVLLCIGGMQGVWG